MTLTELTAKLEQATEPSVDLDIEIWCAINGQERQTESIRFDAGGRGILRSYTNIPPYTASLDAALTLVPKHISYELVWSAAGDGAMRRARMWDWRRGPLMVDRANNFEGVAKTLPLATCIAALKAGGQSEFDAA